MKRFFLGIGTFVAITVLPATCVSCLFDDDKSDKKTSHEGWTKCRDGDFSHAKSRGACSWHGGVSTWYYHDRT